MVVGWRRGVLRRYADLHEVITGAVEGYVRDVRAKDFPVSLQFQNFRD